METISKTDCIKIDAAEDVMEAFGGIINELYEEINFVAETYDLIRPKTGAV